jgi:hypothetical protein
VDGGACSSLPEPKKGGGIFQDLCDRQYALPAAELQRRATRTGKDVAELSRGAIEKEVAGDADLLFV